MTNLERVLRGWVTDWNGEPMARGEPPRDGIHCDVLYDAIEALAAARREGAAEMRERAARVAEEQLFDTAQHIRVLPLMLENPRHD